uniref:Uncharacterized protein n=1 Tax=Timema shepardi TaxID=629360 RepID=A0A7R9B1W9_TIMSH|nr:unnamed protein product [Timema shepardi]
MKCYPVLSFLSDSVPCACCAVVLLYVVGLNCKMGKKCVSIIVLGDIGRSPRMQYHSLSLADEGYNVDVIGYGGSEPMKELLSRENVEIRRLISTPDIKCWFSYLLYCFLCSSIATIVGYKNKSSPGKFTKLEEACKRRKICLTRRKREDSHHSKPTQSSKPLFPSPTLTIHCRSLLYNVDNNCVEHYNAAIVKKTCGKRINFTQRGSYQARCAAAVLSKKLGVRDLSRQKLPNNQLQVAFKSEENSFNKLRASKRQQKHYGFSSKFTVFVTTTSPKSD